MDFYLVKEIRWDSALWTQDWSLPTHGPPAQGGFLGQPPAPWALVFRVSGLGQDPISTLAPWLLAPSAWGGQTGIRL